MKICSKCRIEQPETNFGILRSQSSGHNPYCKPCHCAKMKKYRRSLKGYARQLWLSIKRRKRDVPIYRKIKVIIKRGEFLAWIDNSKRYLKLHATWKKKKYKHSLAPTIDRIKSDGHYVLNNMQIITSEKHSIKTPIDRKKKQQLSLRI